MDQDHISELVDQAKGHDEALLLAGLTILTKDLAEYFAATGHGEEEVTHETKKNRFLCASIQQAANSGTYD